MECFQSVLSLFLLFVFHYRCIQGAGPICSVKFISHSTLVSLINGGSSGNQGGAVGQKKHKKNPGIPHMTTRDHQQSLFHLLSFNCTGNLTQWTFGAKWNGRKPQYPELQIWRNYYTHYSKVASSLIQITTEQPNSVYTYNVYPPLQVHYGDVLGLYQPDHKKSTLEVYLYDGGGYEYYYNDKALNPMSVFNTQEAGVKLRTDYPMVTVVIEPSTSTPSSHIATSTSSTNTIVSTTISSSSTSTPIITLPSPIPIISAVLPSSSLNALPKIPTTIDFSSSFPLPKESGTSDKVAMTTTHILMTAKPTPTRAIAQTLSSFSVKETPLDLANNLDKIYTSRQTESQLPFTYFLKSDSITTSLSYHMPSSQLKPTVVNSNRSDNITGGSHVTSMVIFIVGISIGASACMMGVAIGALCMVIILMKRKRQDNLAIPPGHIGYPGGGRPNRYIQKSVLSPMYEGMADPPHPNVNIPLQVVAQTGSLNSTESTSSTSVHPEVIVTLHPSHAYDRLSLTEETTITTTTTTNKLLSSPVSPYERPVLSEETATSAENINGESHLDECIYVPDERQRQAIFNQNEMTRGYEFDEKLYKSLYKVQSVNDDSKRDVQFFKESSEYWRPQKTANAIYGQLASKRFREIPRQRIQVIQHLGSGQFATVNKAIWKTSGGDVEVAVKMLKTGASEQEKIKFLQEAAINGQFHHLNIVRLLGVVTVGEPGIIVLELLRNGNLKKFLTSKRPEKGVQVSEEFPSMLLNFCKQVAAGMEYLAKKTFIHRDLAARNILVSDQFICKVADFGMSRDLEESSYYVSQGGLVPIKWTAPEAIYYRKYSTASDVWSYGVLLFEIWSLGKKPFGSITNEQYIEQMDEGERLPPPPGCPRLIYQLMINCWHPEASERPSFTSVFQYLSQPKEQLLEHGLSEEEKQESPNGTILGGPLEAGHDLFKNLQTRYLE